MKTVYCFGHVSTGKLYRIKDRFPEANGYGEIIDIKDNYCGEALSTAVVLKRLGVHAILEGNWIGDNEAGYRTLDFLRKEEIDCSGLLVKPGYAGVNEIVISDNVTRTVFGRYVDLLFTDRQWEMPDLQKINRSDIVCIDPAFGEASLLTAQHAFKCGIPFVSIDSVYDSDLVRKAAVVIISDDFIRQKFPHEKKEELFQTYLRNSPGMVIFTFGADMLWYGRKRRNCFAPFRVEAVDTAGAGDSFRAGIVFGMLHNYSDLKMVSFASAVAASVVRKSPGVINFQGMEEVRGILG